MNLRTIRAAVVRSTTGFSLRTAPFLAAIALLAPTHALGQQYSTVYNFAGPYSDGGGPHAGLTLDGSTLYGTTEGGGASEYYGTVYRFDPNSGAERVLHSFSFSTSDGYAPEATVTAVGDNLYGTTELGGSPGSGTIYGYSLATNSETVLHNFVGFTPYDDGGEPLSNLTLVGSTLYGTTQVGGANGVGTIFSYDINTGIEKVVYSFAGNGAAGSSSNDGARPVAGLTLIGSTLYGTTLNGGMHSVGTIFSYNINTGTEGVAYNFAGPVGNGVAASDGSYPYANLTLNGSTLYGTTQAGGTGASGTLFSFNVNTHGENVLYSFGGMSAGDGAQPVAGVTLVGNTLYGTTQYGGPYGSENAGIVYSYDLSTGIEKIVHAFTFGASSVDGFDPVADLTLDGSTLYGTTAKGGTYSSGTIFAVKVPEPDSLLLACLATAGLAVAALVRRHTTC